MTVDLKPIKTAYSAAAGTALVTFEDAVVPAKYVMGKENEGLKVCLTAALRDGPLAELQPEKVILANFIHERWVICCRMARYSRLIYEECTKWVTLRKAFGKPLSEQAVIRAKLGAMLANVDAGQAYLEREHIPITI